jgi:hypothetical protein
MGLDLATATEDLPPDAAVVIYDISFPVAGIEPTYGGTDAGSDSEWIVLAACSPAKTSLGYELIAFGVLHNVDVTEAVRTLISQHGYDRYLGECGGTG